METLLAQPRLATGQTLPQGGSWTQHWEDRRSQGRRVMRRICPRRSGLSWQEHEQSYREERKATDGSTRSRCVFRPTKELEIHQLGGNPATGSTAASTYCQGNLPPHARYQAQRLERLEPYEGKLSRTVLRGGRAGNSPLPLGACAF